MGKPRSPTSQKLSGI